ncbi:unnamed protein product, partial [Didymodactylos carnosus]
MFKAAVVLSQQYNMTVQGQFIGWQSTETGGDAIGALGNTCLIMSTSNIVGIVGPELSREAETIASFAKTVGIPAISYAATAPDLSSRSTYPAFYRTVPSDTMAASSIVKLFNRFNWTSCIIIYQKDEYGTGAMNAINEAFNDNGLLVRDIFAFDIVTLTYSSDIISGLTSDAARIVILWTETTYTSLILQYALDNDLLGPQFVWILSSSVSMDSFNQTSYQNLIGMLTVEPVVGSVVNALVNTTLLNAAFNIWQQYELESFPGPTKVNDYGLFAFDAAWALIQSLQQLCSTTTNSSSSCIPVVNSSFCFDRRFLNADSFFNILTNTEFLGVSGPIQFSVNVTDRISGTYYIVQNVQPSANGVDFIPVLKWSGSGEWDPYTLSNVIVWPGNSLTTPSGKAVLSGVTLRIGVIVAAPFIMATNVTDEYGNTTIQVTGYCKDLIDLLQNAMGFTPEIIVAPLNQTYSGLII